jgi:FAD-linked sulfhydryl oxidase
MGCVFAANKQQEENPYEVRPGGPGPAPDVPAGVPSGVAAYTQMDRGCPVFREELGRATWTLLHTMAAYLPDRPNAAEQAQLIQFMHALSVFYPCKECAMHFRAVMKVIPPVVRTQEEFSAWMCRVHNEVNKRLGKPQFDCTRCAERWRYGWRDGRCN